MDEKEREFERLFYKDEANRLGMRVKELKSTLSYRISAPIRLIERVVNSLSKRAFRANLVKLVGTIRSSHNQIEVLERGWSYENWVKIFDTLSSADVAAIRKDISSHENRPRLTVIVLATHDTKHQVKVSLESLTRQLYSEFEIIVTCIGFKFGDHPFPEDQEVVLRKLEHPSNSHAEAFNAAVGLANGDYLVAIDAGDSLAPHALYMVALAIINDPALDLIYSDDDELTSEGLRSSPFFKPNWSPELALAFNYIGRSTFYRTAYLREINGARQIADNAWRWDLVLRSHKRISSSGTKVTTNIHHLPFVLLHLGSSRQESQRIEVLAGHDVIMEELSRHDQTATLSIDRRGWFLVKKALPKNLPHVTIIIATRDRYELLRKCIDSILAKTDYPLFDVMIVDNLSSEPETLGYFKQLENDPRITVVRYPEVFNFAKLHNQVVRQVRGEILAFLNNDMEVIGSEWLTNLVSYAVDPGVGAVGAKLYYPNDTIQHAAVVLGGVPSAGHLFINASRSAPGPHGLLMISREVSAVTGACLVMRRAVFEEIGGMDEAFSVDYNDIDLCLVLRKHGYRIIWAANVELYHFESATRGKPTTPVELDRYQREQDLFSTKWSAYIANDPYFNPNLSLETRDWSIGVPPRVRWPWSLVARGYMYYLTAMADSLSALEAKAIGDWQKGAALYGMFRAEIGVGEAARGHALALATTDYPVSRHAIPSPNLYSEIIDFECDTNLNSIYNTAVMYLNADTMYDLNSAIPLEYLTRKRRIGVWNWELPVFPGIWAASTQWLDEIWVPSRFVCESLMTTTNKPIRIVPYAICKQTAVPKQEARQQLELPGDPFSFLVVFDTNSYLDRKNPVAAVRAFRDAFVNHNDSSPLLVLKCHGRARQKGQFDSLLELISGDPRIFLIDKVLSAKNISLLYASCDAYVSLHRSEGFGFNIANSMALGKLAIATNFSGNTDYMTHENSMLIPYSMRAVAPDEYIYGAGQWWAEPDHDAAVEAMRAAVDNPSIVNRLSKQAAEDIARENSYGRIGNILVRALEGNLPEMKLEKLKR